MQRGVLLGAGAAVLIVAGVLVVRGVTQHEAGKAVDQGIDQMLANLPPGYAVKHGATGYNPLTGTLTLHDVVVTHAGGVNWTADKVSVSGANQQALRDVFDPAAYPNGHPAWTDRRLLIGDASAEGVHATVPQPGQPPVDMTMHAITLHRLSGRPFAVPPTPQNRQTAGFVADAALAFAVDAQTVDGMAVSAQAPQAFKATIGSAKVSGYDSGKAADVAVQSLAVDAASKPDASPIHATMEAFDIKGADAHALLEGVRQSTDGKAAGMSRLSYDSLNMSALAMQIPQGPTVTLHDMHAEQTPPDANEQRAGKATATGLTIALGGTQVPASAAPGLAAFGMNTITADITAVSQGHAGLTDMHEDIVLHDLGTLHLQGVFAGYKQPTGMNVSAMDGMVALLATKVNQATVVWDDASLTDRIFRVAAEETHTTPQLLHAQLAMPIVTLSMMVPDQPDMADQLTSFLNHPRRLTVTMNPPRPITLGDVGRAPVTERARLLGVHVSAK